MPEHERNNFAFAISSIYAFNFILLSLISILYLSGINILVGSDLKQVYKAFYWYPIPGSFMTAGLIIGAALTILILVKKDFLDDREVKVTIALGYLLT